MTLFERYLSLWVALCIVTGIALGHLTPGSFAAIASLEVANVNLMVAILIWAMIIPMLLRVDFRSLGSLKGHWRGIGVTLFVNWAVKPFSMALLGTFFLGYLFAPLFPTVLPRRISPGSSYWRQPHVRPWFSSGPTWSTVSPTTR